MTAAFNVNRRLALGVSMGIIGTISMQYTIHFGTTILDFRQIAVVEAAMFGGGLASVVAAMAIAAGRIAMFGVDKARLMASALILLIGFSCGLISRLAIASGKKWLLMAVSNLMLTSVVFYILIDDRAILLHIYLGFWSVSLAGGIIIHSLCIYLRQSAEQYHTAQEHAAIDFLTGLNNPRRFHEVLGHSFDKADHHKEQVSFILLDIDHFKQVNDTLRHLSGDEALRQLSDILRNSSRSDVHC